MKNPIKNSGYKNWYQWEGQEKINVHNVFLFYDEPQLFLCDFLYNNEVKWGFCVFADEINDGVKYLKVLLLASYSKEHIQCISNDTIDWKDIFLDADAHYCVLFGDAGLNQRHLSINYIPRDMLEDKYLPDRGMNLCWT